MNRLKLTSLLAALAALFRFRIRPCARAELSHQARDLDRALARRRLVRPCHARLRRGRAEAPRPADRDREQARRIRHAGPGADGGDRQARRLHHRADADHGVPPALHDQDHLRSDQGLHLRGRPHRLHVRRGGEQQVALEDLPGARRLRQGQPRQGQVRHARHRHQPAHRHGADRQADGRRSGRRCPSRARPRPMRRCSAATSTRWPIRRAGARWSTPATSACWSRGAPSAPRTGPMCRR